MKNLILLLLVLCIISCTPNDDSLTTTVNNLKYTLKLKESPNEVILTQEYVFDEKGKVISEKYTNTNYTQYNSLSTFKYNEEGRLIEEIREGEVYTSIVWTNDFAEVYNAQQQKISEFHFNGNLLTSYSLGFNYNSIQTRYFNYDSNQNVISMEDEDGIHTEYLAYDLDKSNPFNLIQSIGILRIDYKPYFKNIFGQEKVHPSQGEDFSQSLHTYEYSYEFDNQDRVIQIEDEKTLIYKEVFQYE